MSTDYTADAMRRQLWAMNCASYDIQLRGEDGGENQGRVIWERGLTPEVVMRRQPFYRSHNAQGFGIFIQPARGTDRALILADDIEDPDELIARGVTPCSIVETSQANFQCWIDLGPEPMPPAQRHAVSSLLVEEFGCDDGAKGSLHLGRLAGFVNRKKDHADKYGMGPWVYARHSKPGACSKAAAIRTWAAKYAPTLPGTPAHDLAHVQTSKRSPEGKPGAAEAFARALDNARKCERMAADDSLADFAATCSCLRQGYAPGDIQAALQASIEASPDRLRKHHNPADYARRTVRKAAEEVAKERARSMGARDL